MKRTITLTLSVIATFSLFTGCATTPAPLADAVWVPDNGDGTYKNPIIFADYSDPDVVRLGDDFYLTASSFNCMPALPILHSRDLVNWELIGHAFDNYDFPQFDEPQHGNGVWAPSIRHHNGEFYIYYGDPDLGIFMTRAKDPAGPWSPLHRVKEAAGWIDPCPFWDNDGKAYLVHAFAKSRSGTNSILTINRMSPDGTRLLDEGTCVFDGHTAHPTIEGPKMYKRNGYYYIFAPGGGVTPGWQTVLRSTNVFGPYEDKVVLAQGDTQINGPHQGGWVELDSGENWFIHFQDRGAYGRITHLQPVHWINDWPVMGIDRDGDGTGEPVLSYQKPNVGRTWPMAVPATTDEFNSTARGLQWQWQANFKENWSSLTEHRGWLRLFAQPRPKDAANLWPVPSLLLQKLPAPGFTATTSLDATGLADGGKAGLVMFGMDYAYLAVERSASGLRLTRVTCKDARGGKAEIEEATAPLSGDQVFLRVTVRPEAVCSFSYSADGDTFVPIGPEFTAVEGRWIGAKVGLFCLQSIGGGAGGHADFDWFRAE